MKKTVTALALFVGAGLILHAQDAGEIVRSSRNRIKADTVSTRSRMVIADKNGSTRDRVIEQFSKDGPKGKRTVIEFIEPATVKGIRFLTMENPGGADDRWIYLPERGGDPTRIAASDGSKSFQGSDFSNDDISSANRGADLDTHKLLREESLNGGPCYVIESVPRDSSYQYSKMIQWIDRDSRAAMKIELYNKRGELVKVLETLKLEEKEGRLTAMSTKMSTLAAGTSTTLNVELVRYDIAIPERIFTPAFLKDGKRR